MHWRQAPVSTEDATASLFTLARLLTADDSKAVELVNSTYKKLGFSPHCASCNASERLRLFSTLHGEFQRNYKNAQIGTQDSEESSGPSTPQSVRRMIYRQEPVVRFMIFLRHVEDVSLNDVARIVGRSPETVKSCLLNFRHQCGAFSATA
jgi:DNA-directed RNA polymerase specialized sigma24 family protein